MTELGRHVSRRLDIVSIVGNLAKQRPVFHSEADFQFALAWTIREYDPTIKVRLEYPVPDDASRGHIDIWLCDASGPTAIELKYWTRKATVDAFGERFRLKDQSAQNFGRYDFWKDVVRIENLIAQALACGGYVIAVTNDQRYWNERKAGTNDEAFRLHDGRCVCGPLEWFNDPPKGRGARLEIQGHYQTCWRCYSQLDGKKNGLEFRYLLLDIGEVLAARKVAG